MECEAPGSPVPLTIGPKVGAMVYETETVLTPGSKLILGVIRIVRSEHTTFGLVTFPPLPIPIPVIVLAKTLPFVRDVPFRGLPPPASAIAIPNPPSSKSSMVVILAINNRDDIEVFFKLKFVFVI